MASKKTISIEAALEFLYAEDSGDELIPGLDSSDSDNEDEVEIPFESAEVVSEILSEASPSYRPLLPDFTANVDQNIEVTDSDNIMSFVNIFITDEFIEYICEQTNLYAEQIISAAPRPFTKYSIVQTWEPVSISK
jgi:hypothetical protein